MQILVVGAGAVGGYFGGRLAEAGKDVTFLVRPRKADAIRKHGLRIVSPHGNATVHPKLITAGEITAPYDLVILGVKAYSLEAAIHDFAAAVGSGTLILPFLNGMRHIERLTRQFGEDPVLGGVCLITAEVDEDERIVQLTKIHQLIFGERAGGLSKRMDSLNQTMQGPLLDARTSENIVQEMWEKWVMLASLGAATCLMRANIGEIEAATGGAELAREILRECSAIATASGYPPRAAFLERTEKMLTKPHSTLTSSMFRDLKRNTHVEVEQILGDLLLRAQAAGVSVPLVEAACLNLRIYQARLKQ